MRVLIAIHQYTRLLSAPRSESVREAERERGRVVVGGERVCERERARARERERARARERERARVSE